MNRQHPVFSVVMPMYNVQAYIRQAIDSVLNQSFGNFELICVDDGCTDGTLAIVQGYSDSRIRLVRQHNQGLSAARNTGINHSRGLFVAFLDSDDYWARDKLWCHFNHFSEQSDLAISYSASLFVDEQGQPMGIGQFPKLRNIQPQDVFCRNPIGNGSAAVFRRSVLTHMAFVDPQDPQQRVQYFDERLRQSEDVDFWIRLALEQRWLFQGIGKGLTYYRVNASGLSANLNNQFAAWQRSVEKNRALDPVFFDRWYGLACAYQLRYLARRAVKSGQGITALSLCLKALATDARILVQEPKRTTMTLAASLAALLPKRLFERLQHTFLRYKQTSH